ncbi:acetolactate synthase 2 small subunit [Orbaceae bacterium ESL0727]|nr:acetolactate synthase 2 small subunit [Orbaceae bacterium ESL0727]
MMQNSHNQPNRCLDYQLHIQAYDRLGELERILRVIRHRGGHIHALTMQSDENGRFSMQVTLTTERAIETLGNQIAKLANVLDVNEIKIN